MYEIYMLWFSLLVFVNFGKHEDFSWFCSLLCCNNCLFVRFSSTSLVHRSLKRYSGNRKAALIADRNHENDQTFGKTRDDKRARRRELYRLMPPDKKEAILARRRANRAELKRRRLTAY
ncbi:hypothetical protein A4A49_18114 [Nicotiana attenuata]|uniref:Uncharacterized protein n=1 Tax=Nicotiana attenuata TaxID=49451 RepID=A0A314KP81_NICAT|nr:hypothetical protein A4A49_18114 [Nicotiana attenuata]